MVEFGRRHKRSSRRVSRRRMSRRRVSRRRVSRRRVSRRRVSRRRVSRRRMSRRRMSRRRMSRRRSQKGIERVGNRVTVAGRGGKMKTLKVKKDKDGNEFYVTGKTKKKHFLEGKRSHRRKHRRFGSKDSLLSMMGNFQPRAQMSLAQSTTGFSAPQMVRHMQNVPKSVRSNFYTEIR